MLPPSGTNNDGIISIPEGKQLEIKVYNHGQACKVLLITEYDLGDQGLSPVLSSKNDVPASVAHSFGIAFHITPERLDLLFRLKM